MRISGKFLLLLISLLATLPIWLSPYPPMSDLPQHAAQIALLQDLHNPNFAFASLYRIHWFTPYLFGYMLVYAIASLVGIAMACKIVVALLLVAVPLTTALLLRWAGIDRFWAILTIPGLYGFALQWGFLNFVVAAPVGILFLTFVLYQAKNVNIPKAALIAACTIGLFFCHALVCAFLLLVAGGYTLLEIRPIKKAALLLASFAAVVPVAGLWAHNTMSSPGAKRPSLLDLHLFQTVEPYYAFLLDATPHQGWGRLSGFFPRLFGMREALPSLLIGLAILILPLIAGMRFQKRFSRWLPLLVCLAILFFLPATLFGTDFTYQRFAVFLLPMFLLVLKPAGTEDGKAQWAKVAAVLLVVGCVANFSYRTWNFGQQAKQFRQLEAQMQPGQRTLSMVFNYDHELFLSPIYLHFPSWYAAEKAGVVDPSVAMMHPELVVYREGKTPHAVLWDFEWNPDEFEWQEFHGDLYRYFVVKADHDISPEYFAKAPCTVQLRYHVGEWWLYERVGACPATPSEE